MLSVANVNELGARCEAGMLPLLAFVLQPKAGATINKALSTKLSLIFCWE